MTNRTRASARDVPWLNAAKGLALLWIVLNHVVEALAGGAEIGNPSPQWPPLAARIAQLVSPAFRGIANAPLALVRDVGWLGDEGVGVFLVLSGLGLGCGLVRAERFDVGGFFRRRFARIYPEWLVAHATIGTLLVTLGKASPLILLLSAIGIRFLPSTYEALVPAWWFMGLLLQLYAIVPVLWWAAQRFGAARMAIGAIALGLVIRALVWPIAGAYIDEWSRGAIFITRLPEFVCGFAFALMCGADPARLSAPLRSPRVLGAAVVAFAAGNALADAGRRPRDSRRRRALGCRVVVVMVPASIQVCRPDQLPYYPQHVDFDDRRIFDPQRPQRLARTLSRALGVQEIDLRDAFHDWTCPYAPHNMHWTRTGQADVAAYLGRRLAPTFAVVRERHHGARSFVGQGGNSRPVSSTAKPL